jgi:hypothetical protein
MKKLLIYCIFLLTLFSSCEKYLEEDVKSFVLTDDYYVTKVGYTNLVNSVYSSLRDIYKGDPYIFCAGTDMYVHGRTVQPMGLSEYKDLRPTEVTGQTDIRDLYFNSYKSIMLANCGLYYIDKVTGIAASDLKKFEGELRFLRAYNYFTLVQQFGGVPIVKDYSIVPQMSYDRNEASDVYTFIIDEMKAAALLVADAAINTAPTGKINKRIVKHYLAKVFLTRGYESYGTANDFSTAAKYADSTINGQTLTISFEDLFYPGKEKNEEVLFAVQYDATSIDNPTTGGNRQNAYFGPYLGGEGSASGYPWRNFALCPTMYTYDLFTQDDSRFNATFMVNAYGVFSSTGKYTGRYYDYYDKSSSRKSLKIAYFFAPKWMTPDDITAWVAADTTNRSKTIIYPYGPDWVPTYSTGDFKTPIVKKFDDPKSTFSITGSSTRDIYLARLGETYLIAAEAYFKSGNSIAAADRINEVRKRAAVSGKSLAINPADVSIDFILDERGRELLGEYHRWTDLKRTGTLKTRTRLYNMDIKAIFDSGTDPFTGPDGKDKILRPIPQETIDANNSSNFPQNPGY